MSADDSRHLETENSGITRVHQLSHFQVVLEALMNFQPTFLILVSCTRWLSEQGLVAYCSDKCYGSHRDLHSKLCPQMAMLQQLASADFRLYRSRFDFTEWAAGVSCVDASRWEKKGLVSKHCTLKFTTIGFNRLWLAQMVSQCFFKKLSPPHILGDCVLPNFWSVDFLPRRVQ